MSNLKKKIIIVVIVLLLVTAIVTPTTLLMLERRVDTTEVVLQSFVINYGTKGALRTIQRVKDIYIVQYEDAEANYTLLYIDGIWVELGSTLKESP